jgi:glycosyltransferase involved in cell wall biosynthesis
MATLAPHKGLHVLLQALKQVSSGCVTLDVYGPDGDGNYADECRKLAARDTRVRFHGAVRPEEVGECLAKSDVLALPAQWYENDPLIVKSALYVGVPVVLSDLGSLTEMVNKSQFGWLLPPNDPSAWAAWIENVATPAALASLPPAPAVATEAEFAQQLFAIYESLAGKNQSSNEREAS